LPDLWKKDVIATVVRDGSPPTELRPQGRGIPA